MSNPLIKLGAISFVNTVPIYSDFQPNPDTELVYEVPARLNAKILAGELQVSPVSSACYLRNKKRLILLDDLSVSSPGAVESVLFLSSKPLGPEMLDVPVISVPNDSETSVALLAYLLKEATGRDLQPWFQSYEAADYRQTLAETGNALIIGDNALLAKASGLADGYHVYDLSTLWKERTGLPFVFAVWVADAAWAKQAPEKLAQLNADLCAARDRFFQNPDVFGAGLRQAQERSQLPSETLNGYYRQCLSYQLDSDHRASLALFETLIESSIQNAAAVQTGSPSPEPSQTAVGQA